MCLLGLRDKGTCCQKVMNTKHKTLTRQVSCPEQPSPSTGRGFSTPCERLLSIVERPNSSFLGLRKQKPEPGYSPAPHQGCLRSFSGCFLRVWATRSWSPPSSATGSQSRIKNITGKSEKAKILDQSQIDSSQL